MCRAGATNKRIGDSDESVCASICRDEVSEAMKLFASVMPLHARPIIKAVDPEKYSSTASTGMYRSDDFLDKSVTGIAVVPRSRCGFSDLGAFLHLIKMD